MSFATFFPSFTPTSSIYIYNSLGNCIICTQCKRALGYSLLERHLRDNHSLLSRADKKIIISNLQEELSINNIHPTLHFKDLQPLPNDSLLIKELPIIKVSSSFYIF